MRSTQRSIFSIRQLAIGNGKLVPTITMKDHRPRIGITMRIELPTDRFYLGRHYSEAIHGAGGAPVHISLIPDPEYVASVVDSLDGILLPGSDSDVDPIRYRHDPHPALGTVHPIKDQTDLLVLDEIEKRRLPLLSICYGMQILNVARGGTLIQDIETQLPEAIKHEQGVPRDRPSHRVKLLEGSLLASLAAAVGTQDPIVNSHHHQAIETVGEKLVATAWTGDGLIEALEDSRPDRFVTAVQWHPELGWMNDEFSQLLFQTFVSKARDYSASEKIASGS
jgi:putative glutamine amidotransferase